MRIAKTALVFALLLLVGVGVFGQKKTVTFMCIEADLPKAFVDKFNAANPDINLVRVEEDWTKWTADAMAGSASDLIRMGIGSDTAYYSKRGLLYDMSSMLKTSKIVKYDDIDKAANSSYQFDGKEFGKGAWYGLVKDFNNIGALTYNKEMFKAAGIAPMSETKPITYYNDLFNLAKKLTKKDSSGKVTVWGYDVNSTWVQFLVTDMATASNLSFYGDAKRSVLNNDPKMRELWKYFPQFPVADIASNIRNPNSGWEGSAFQSDRIAIAQLGYWYGAQLQTNAGYNEKYGWAPTPIMKAGVAARHQQPRRRHGHRDVLQDQGCQGSLPRVRMVHGGRLRHWSAPAPGGASRRFSLCASTCRRTTPTTRAARPLRSTTRSTSRTTRRTPTPTGSRSRPPTPSTSTTL